MICFFVPIVDAALLEITRCPNNIEVPIGVSDVHKTILWREPEALDNSHNVALVYQSHSPGDNFYVGKTDVSYTFVDDDGNAAFCNFTVTLTPGKAKMYNNNFTNKGNL